MMPIASAIASNVAAKAKDAEGQPQNEDQRALPPPPPAGVDQGLWNLKSQLDALISKK